MTITVLERTEPVARKAHWCSSCGNEIPKGSRYLRAGLVYEDRVYTWKSHEACTKAGELLLDEYDIWGDAGCDSIVNVIDMDAELRELVRDADPALHAEIAEYCKNWRD